MIIITFIPFRYSTRITCTKDSTTLNLTNIWGSTRASKNISPSYVWSILWGCKIQWPRTPGTTITTQNICKVSENTHIAPKSFVRRWNCKDNVPKLNSTLYNFKFKFNVTKFQVHSSPYSLQFHAPNSPSFEDICMFSLPSYIQTRIFWKLN